MRYNMVAPELIVCT